MLVAAGIDARRERPDTGTVITLRKVPTNDASNASDGENRSNKGEAAGIKEDANASSNARSDANASANASENPTKEAASGNTGNTGNRNGDSWQSDPMRHYRRGGTA